MGRHVDHDRCCRAMTPADRPPPGDVATTAGPLSVGEGELEEPATNTDLSRLEQRLVSDGMWAVGGKAVAAGSTFLLSVLITRLLSPTEVGAYFLALSVVTVAALAARVGLEKTILQLVAESLGADDEPRARAAVLRILAIAAVTVALFALALTLGGAWMARRLFASEAMAGIGVLLAPWMAYLAFERLLAEAFRGFHDIPRASLYGGAVSRALCVLGLLVVLWAGGATLRLVVLLTIGCGAIALGPAAAALRRKLRGLRRRATDSVSTARVLRTTWPLLVSNVTILVTGHADLWILGAFRPDTEVALYGVAVRLVLLVGMSLAIVNAVLPPLIGELYVQGQRDRLERVTRTLAAAAALPSVAVLAVFLVAGGPILELAFGPFYRGAALVLGLLSVAQMFNVWVGPCGYLLIMTGHQRDLMWSAILAGFIAIVGGVATVGPLGVVGVASAVALGTIVQQLSMLWLARSRCHIWTHASPRLLYRRLGRAIRRTGAS